MIRRVRMARKRLAIARERWWKRRKVWMESTKSHCEEMGIKYDHFDRIRAFIVMQMYGRTLRAIERRKDKTK